MSFLRLYDYTLNSIQQTLLTQLTVTNDAARVVEEQASQSKITSYLAQKWDMANAFPNTTEFSNTAIYKANDLVELNYPAWASQDYTVNQLVVYTDGNVYLCILGTTLKQAPGNITYWTNIGAQYALYYIAYPYPVFNLQQFYNVGDIVFWKGKIYQCLIPSVTPNHSAELNAWVYANFINNPLSNFFPDDPKNGAASWGAGTAYSVTSFVPNAANPSAWSSITAYTIGNQVLYNGLVWQALKSSTNVKPGADIVSWQSQTWTLGDNRNAEIVKCYVWLTIRGLAPLISPRNIPEYWNAKYNEYLRWLQMCAEGKITLALPVIQPPQGGRIRYTGQVKNWNGY